jgi:FixJ family two-component response regulator
MTMKLISVVDDDESTRRSTTLLLESLGFQASAFESAETFLKSGQAQQTSCLIVDVRMPGMDGLQLQSHLAAAGHGIPIIFITGYDDKDSRQRAMQAGAVAFLGKPFGDELLLQTIRAALREGFEVTRALISVVDDDESVRRTTNLLVESFGFRAAAFESAESLLRSGKLDETSCLIVDMQLPGMNGLQLQSHIAAAGSNVPIIFITAYDHNEFRQKALKAGAVAFLGKPFSDEVLLQTIRKSLRHDNESTKTT